MLKSLKTISVYLFISLAPIWNSYSQTISADNDFLLQNFILSFEGGIYYGFTDYKTSNIEPGIRGSIEYFPIIINNARLGLKLFGGGTSLSFNDNRGLIANNDEPNPKNIPPDIYTDIIQIGGSVNFGLSLSESLISYLNVGAAYLIFNPKSSDGVKLEFNRLEKYDKEIVSFLVEGGLRYKLSDRFGLNLALGYHPTSTDYLDDISAASGNDSYLFGLLGVSFALSGNIDSDGDGVKNNIDMCPNDKEDLDGFEDEDGCPDSDNDKDGILDMQDKCLNDAEDKDGFEDWDGCPDTDNDRDGILDVNDKCPDEAEDTDGFKDEDGCPDPDNDSDGILDVNDKCPDVPESINNIEDADGCPETATQQDDTFYQFILRGDDTFEPNSATLIGTAKILLNEIAGYIKNQPGSKWRIEGHTDNQGSPSLLKKLSYNRAKAVYEYLISQGLPAEQFSLYGLGSSSSVANNDTPEGRSTNRRIIIIRED